VNATFRRPDGTLPIPPDPTRHVHAARFRRSLAYFIVRRPRGLIAAALQYAHVSTKVTLSYSGSADTSWMDDLAIERLEMVVDQIGDDLALLEDGEHVSGPATAGYRARIAKVSRFAGRPVTHVRNVQRLLDSADPRIHHGEAMTCVWRAETAACRKAKIAQGLPADDAPDEAECRTTCTNLAYTERDIEQMSHELAGIEATAADPLAPVRCGTEQPLAPRVTRQSSHAITHHGPAPQTTEKARRGEPHAAGTAGRTHRDPRSRRPAAGRHAASLRLRQADRHRADHRIGTAA
jgi:hypothetical protein